MKSVNQFFKLNIILKKFDKYKLIILFIYFKYIKILFRTN